MSGDFELTCARDGVPTRLRCANCDIPICPACFVRTEVGLRCPTCGGTRPGSPPKRRHRHLGSVAVLGAVVMVVGIVAAVARQDSARPEAATPPPTQVLELEAVPVTPLPPTPPPPPSRPPAGALRNVDRQDLGIAFAIPADWAIAPRDPAGGAFLATSPLAGGGPVAWFRILTYPGSDGVAPTAARVIGKLLGAREGVRDLVSNPTLVATRPAWYVRFTAPFNVDGSGPPTEQTYYFVELNEGIAALTFGSLGSGGTGRAALAQATIASLRFR